MSLRLLSLITLFRCGLVFAYLPNDVCFVINTRIAKKLELPLKLINHVTIDPLSPYSLKLINLVKSGQSVVIFPGGSN